MPSAVNELPAKYVFDVMSPMMFPVVATTGQVLVVSPGTDQPILVVTRGTTTVIRTGPPNYGALIHLLIDGVLVERTPAARVALHRVSGTR